MKVKLVVHYQVFNFELEEAAEGDYRHREFREPECVQLSDQLLVAGFVFGHVCVWSIASKKLVIPLVTVIHFHLLNNQCTIIQLHILYDNPLVAGHIIEESSLAAEYVRLSEDGSLFLTCLTSVWVPLPRFSRDHVLFIHNSTLVWSRLWAAYPAAS